MSKSRRREPFEVVIDNLSHEGRGVGRVNGKTIFVAGALPGETALVRKTRGRKSFDEGIALEITNPNPDRIEAKCSHYEICGGCSLQHLPADKQIEHKQSVLLELFSHHANATPQEILPPLTADQWHYRRRARLGVKFVEKKGGALVGFREKASPYIADIASCEVLDKSVGYHLGELRELVNGLSIPDKVPQLEVAIGDATTAIIVRHLESFSAEDLSLLEEFQEKMNISLFLQPSGESSVHPLNEHAKQLSYNIDDIEFSFTPSNFVQVNQSINRRMISIVSSHLDLNTEDNLLDLFCGLGNFTLPLSRQANSVHGIEGDTALVELAKKNALANDITNATFAKMDLADEDFLKTLDLRKFNKILLDPPRSGAESILTSGDLSEVETVAYVSCNPVTLARDAKHLVEKHGFCLSKLGVMDMFPHTSHVESLAIFKRS